MLHETLHARQRVARLTCMWPTVCSSQTQSRPQLGTVVRMSLTAAGQRTQKMHMTQPIPRTLAAKGQPGHPWNRQPGGSWEGGHGIVSFSEPSLWAPLWVPLRIQGL